MPLSIKPTSALSELATDVTLSGTAQGDILIRGASKWNNLPAGASGTLLTSGGAGANPSWSTLAHSSLTGLTTGDPHTQYPLQAGRAGGQSITGGTASGESLTLNSTSHSTKGKIFFGANSAYDGANNRLGINQTSPTAMLHVIQSGTATPAFFNGTDSNNRSVIFERTAAGQQWAINLNSNRFALEDVTGGVVRMTIDTAANNSSVTIGNTNSALGTSVRLTVDNNDKNINCLSLLGASSVTQTAALFTLAQKTSTTQRLVGNIDANWANSTDATRMGRMTLSTYDTSAREGLRIESNGSQALVGVGGISGTPAAVLHVANIVTTTPSVLIKGMAAQSGDFLQITNSSSAYALKVTALLSVIAGKSGPATSDTDGFVYLPVMAGTPSGTPTAQTGYAPMVVDSSGSRLWVYIGGVWKSCTLA